MSWLKIPHIKQAEPAWCLPACVCMVTAYWEQPLVQQDVAQWLGTRYFGTPASKTVRLTQRGFDVLYREGSLAELQQWVAQSVPCIVFVQAFDLPHWDIETMHALVVVGFDEANVYVHDPFMDEFPLPVPIDYLMVAWTPFDYKYAVIRPA